MKKLLISLLVAVLFNCSYAQKNKNVNNADKPSNFVEKSRIEVSQNEDKTLNFKNIGKGSAGIKMSMSLDGSSQSIDGFYVGTLLIVDSTNLTIDKEFDRLDFKINCTYKIQSGTMIEIHDEGMISQNLKFIRNGIVNTDFGVEDASGKIILKNKRKIEIKKGKIQKISFEDETKPKEILCNNGKYVDLKTMNFELKQSDKKITPVKIQQPETKPYKPEIIWTVDDLKIKNVNNLPIEGSQDKTITNNEETILLIEGNFNNDKLSMQLPDTTIYVECKNTNSKWFCFVNGINGMYFNQNLTLIKGSATIEYPDGPQLTWTRPERDAPMVYEFKTLPIRLYFAFIIPKSALDCIQLYVQGNYIVLK